MDTLSPSSSPTSVTVFHQDTSRPYQDSTATTTTMKRNNNSTHSRPDQAAGDEKSDCGASNPQQAGASVHSCSTELEDLKVAATERVREEHSRPRRSHRTPRFGTTGNTTIMPSTTETRSRQKRPPRLIETRPNMKIPPTHKDNRKLFVGGLPVDGTFVLFAGLAILPCLLPLK
jgi:hypothetical protein